MLAMYLHFLFSFLSPLHFLSYPKCGCPEAYSAKSVYNPSSQQIKSNLKKKPGINLFFFIQKIAQKDPEKKTRG
jgi:hypothetical protein